MTAVSSLIRPVAPVPPPPGRPAGQAPARPGGVLGADAYAPSAARQAGPQPHARFAAHAELQALRYPGSAPLSRGARGPHVEAVQQALIAMAFAIPSGVDGAFGGQTAVAIGNFQAMAGLPRTGMVDAATFQALERFAPPEGLHAWDKGANAGPVPSPKLPGGGVARVVVSISQHRVFLFDKAGKLAKIYGARTGAAATPTVPGLKVINAKVADPTDMANQLWPESQGKAFGTKLLALTDVDPKTRKPFHGPNGGQELHGTYVEHSIGKDFSHGCVGLRNADIEEIYQAVGKGAYVRFDA